MSDFIVTHESAARYLDANELDWAHPLWGKPFSVFVQHANRPEHVLYCLWFLPQDTAEGAHKRLVRFALNCARRMEHHAGDYPAVKACNDLVQRWLDGDAIAVEDLRQAAGEARVPYKFCGGAYGAWATSSAAAYTAVNESYAVANADTAAKAARRTARSNDDCPADIKAECDAQRQDMLAIWS